MYFIWTTRDKQAFEWFQSLLSKLEEDGVDELVEMHTYLTQKLAMSEIKHIIVNDDANSVDPITRLRARTHYGRPNLDKVFGDIRNRHPSTDVGVFFCGPVGMSGALHKACNKWTESTDQGTRFYYGKGKISMFEWHSSINRKLLVSSKKVILQL